MTTVAEQVRITEPGVYDIPPEVYHADPVPGGSLSHSGARLLIPPSCPAKYAHQLEHGEGHRREWDLGHAAHRLVLGAGQELVRVEADGWRTNDAKAARAEAYEAGRVPLLAHEHDQVQEMAAAVHAHPVAGQLFRAGAGAPERSLFWRDPVYPYEVIRRARLDWLPVGGRGRMILPEYKTAKSAEPSAIERAMWDHGYHIQAGWYADGVTALDLARDAVLILVVQEKDPPYLVETFEPDAPSLRVGRMQTRQAIDIYRECRRTGRWPGYTDDVTLISLPPWAQRQFTEETW